MLYEVVCVVISNYTPGYVKIPLVHPVTVVPNSMRVFLRVLTFFLLMKRAPRSALTTEERTSFLIEEIICTHPLIGGGGKVIG